MQRILIQHLSGSKANQVEQFSRNEFSELTFGRELDSNIKYDPNIDDLVGRRHAKLVLDEAERFTLVDLSSRNGTFVNQQRITGFAKVWPGDVIQFGPNGPEFQLDIEPRKLLEPRPTRLATNLMAGGNPAKPKDKSNRLETAPTRHSEVMPNTDRLLELKTKTPIGRTTVLQMISQTQGDSKRHLFWGLAAVLGLCGLVLGVFSASSHKSQQALGQELNLANQSIADSKQAFEEYKTGLPMTPTAIAAQFSDATVYIEVSWKLIDTDSGKQVFQEQNGGKPVFLQFADRHIEPFLSLTPNDSQGVPNIPIGGSHTGTGFVVSNDGFVMTNRHVAATWETSYHFPPVPGKLMVLNSENRVVNEVEIQKGPTDWVPTKSLFFGGKPLIGKTLEGRNDYLDVTFSKNKLRIPGRLVRVSDRHDVAMIKIDTPQSLHKVELYDDYDSIQTGNTVSVLGFPGVSPNVAVVTASKDPFNRGREERVVPDVTLSYGNIGRIFRDQEPQNTSIEGYFSGIGVSYQLTINSTGTGNSGGPLFDDRGRVIGVFYAGSPTVTFAVPIRYGLELMGISPVIK